MKQLPTRAEAFQKWTIFFLRISGYDQEAPMQDACLSASRASSQRWTFLNLNVGLEGDARTKFDQAEELNGLDAWRRPIEPKTLARRVTTHTDIHAPPRAKKLS